jgi:hypothetical protein
MDFQIRNTHYTTLDRRRTFTFDFVRVESAGTWRVYIRAQPPYEGRNESAVSSHRLSDARGRYICWDQPLRTLDEAKGVARAWSDATNVYIDTGRFPAPGPARPVPDVSSSARWPHRTSAAAPPVARAPDPPPPATRPRAALPAPPTSDPSRRRTLGGWLSNIWRDE